MVKEFLSTSFRVIEIDDLNLADEDGVCRAGVKSTGQSSGTSSTGKSSDDGWFFDGQRYDVVLAVDQEIKAKADGQSEHADDVFDHLVGYVKLKRVVACFEGAKIAIGDKPSLMEGANTFFNSEFEEVGDS